jgi:hypothetical protein
MPLDPLQDRIARIAGTLPEARTVALAGGGAMIVHGFVSRETKDVDLFTEAATVWPSRASSPWILRCPHRLFSVARRTMSWRIAAGVAGRPGVVRRAV